MPTNDRYSTTTQTFFLQPDGPIQVEIVSPENVEDEDEEVLDAEVEEEDEPMPELEATPSGDGLTWNFITNETPQELVDAVRAPDYERVLRERPRRVAVPDRLRRGRVEPMPLPAPTPATGLRVEDMSFRFLSWQSEGFDQVVRTIYPFFSRHSDRHYSEATMRQLADISIRYADWTARNLIDRLHSEMPVIAVASMPFRYDEETEIKTGGTTGMLVCFPNRGFKSVLAVHRNGRRSSIATTLWQNISYRIPTAAFWVHRSNVDGQHFLLSLDFYPTAMNSSGSIRYSQVEDDE